MDYIPSYKAKVLLHKKINGKILSLNLNTDYSLINLSLKFTICHVHRDIWLKGFRLFLGFGDEEDSQERQQGSVQNRI